MLRNLAPAEYPTPATIEMATRGGTPQFHGSATYMLRSPALVATHYFSPARPRGAPTHGIGFDFGGPVFIPKLYNGKNRTFFYFDYEFNPSASQSQSRLYNVPTAAMREGNYNGLARPVTLLDPITGQPFPGNQIPAGRMNATSRSILSALIPAPNAGSANDPIANLARQVALESALKLYNFKVDHNLTSRGTLSLSSGWGLQSGRNDAGAPGSSLPGIIDTGHRFPRQTYSLTYTHTFSPTVVNETRFGYSRQVQNSSTFPLGTSGRGTDFLSTFGIQGIDPGVDAQAWPGITFNDVFPLPAASQNRDIRNYFHFANNVSVQKGAHSLKMGADVRRFHRDILSVNSGSYGDTNFSGRWTGSGFADFLLGLPDTTSVQYPRPLMSGRYWEMGFYVQDKWAVNSWLTLTLGLRAQLWTEPLDERGLYYNFDPKTGRLVVPSQEALASVHSLFPVNIPIKTASEVGFPSALRDLPSSNWAPRIAFAIRPFNDNKTAIRGGFGVYHSPVTFDSLLPSIGGPFTVSNTFQNQLSDGQFLFQYPRPVPLSAGTRVGGLGGLSVTAINPFAPHIPYTMQFNFTAEREIARDTRLSLGYVGSKSTQLYYRRNINVPAPSTTPFTPARRPYPLFNVVNMADIGGNQTYHSLELLLYRRFSGGFQFEGGWVWANALNDVNDSGSDLGSGIANPFNRSAEKGRQEDIVKHSFKGNFLWELPLGKGRRFLSGAPPVVDYVLGGWTISHFFEFRTGEFLTPVFTGRDISGTGITSGRPDRIGDGNVSGLKNFRNSTFNLADMPIPAANSGRFGNGGRGYIVGPNNKNANLGLYKHFKLYETLQFRLGASMENAYRWIGFGYHEQNVTSPQAGPG